MQTKGLTQKVVWGNDPLDWCASDDNSEDNTETKNSLLQAQKV